MCFLKISISKSFSYLIFFLKVMDSLKTRIDAYASSLDGFDVLLERGIKFLRSRADRYEKVS